MAPATARVAQSGLVHRDGLVDDLTRAGSASVVLIVAPAGYGKSTLLAQWADAEERPVVQVRLGPADAEPARMLRRILAAMHEIAPVDAAAFAALETPVPDVTGVVRARLADVMEGLARPMVLAVDDAHEVTSPAGVALLRTMVDHAAPGFTLALFSRRTLSRFPVGRLRAERRLLELGAGDLAMDPGEADALLRRAGVALQPAVVHDLWRHTEGWPAGLYLAALSVRDRADQAAAVARFTGGSRIVSDYLGEEVLARLSDVRLDVLRRAAVLDELDGPRCDAVLGRTGSAALLEELAGDNLLLQPVDGRAGTYRCHGLLREALLARLHRDDPAAEAAAHRRAAMRYREEGDLERAAEHAVSSGDAELTGEVLWEHVPFFCSQGRILATQRWLARLPEAGIASVPTLSMTASASWLTIGDLQRAEHWRLVAFSAMDRASSVPARRSLEAAGLIIHTAAGTRGVAQMAQDAARAYEIGDVGGPWRSFACLMRGVACHLAGDPEQARDWLDEGSRRAAVEVPNIDVLCLAQRALVELDEGGVLIAEDLMQRAGRQVTEHHLGEYPTLALAVAVDGLVHARLGRMDEAKSALRDAEQLLTALGDFAPWYLAETRIVLARLSMRLADAEQARRLLGEASRAARRVSGAAALGDWIASAWREVDDRAVATMETSVTLTRAELRILRFLPTHLSFREIGLRLHVSTNTVKTQARAVYRKLGVASRSEAVVRARQVGLLDP